MTVGILALQGDFREHEQLLQRMGVSTQLVRLPKHLDLVDRVIIPGGESTTIGKLLVFYGLLDLLRERAQMGMPLWGTCAGAILMARQIAEGRTEGQPSLGLMDVTARRNAFGRQLDSFEADLSIPKVSPDPLRAVFIRAPVLESPAREVEVLARLDDGRIVAAQQQKLLATCFHPELVGGDRFHRYFLDL